MSTTSFNPDPYFLSRMVWKVILCLVTVLLLALLLSGCSANWHLKTALRKDQSIIDTTRVVTSDTVKVEVPVVRVVEKLKRDTLVEYLQGEVLIRYRYNTKTDTIMIEADCPDHEVVTVTDTRTVHVKVKPTWQDVGKWLLLGACAMLFVLVTIFQLRKN
jgi:hypothetical protein